LVVTQVRGTGNPAGIPQHRRMSSSVLLSRRPIFSFLISRPAMISAARETRQGKLKFRHIDSMARRPENLS
jgi:hypothetical protein